MTLGLLATSPSHLIMKCFLGEIFKQGFPCLHSRSCSRLLSLVATNGPIRATRVPTGILHPLLITMCPN